MNQIEKVQIHCDGIGSTYDKSIQFTYTNEKRTVNTMQFYLNYFGKWTELTGLNWIELKWKKHIDHLDVIGCILCNKQVFKCTSTSVISHW